MKPLPFGAYLDSVGYLAQTFQRPVSEIEAILAAAGCEPALVLNGVRHFDRSAYLALREDSDGE